MSQIKPISLPNGAIILMESDDDVQLPDVALNPPPEDDVLVSKSGVLDEAAQKVQDFTGTLKNLAAYTVDAFKEAGGSNVEKVTLEFGVKVAGEMGIPYITKGSGEGSIKITVQCAFPNDS